MSHFRKESMDFEFLTMLVILSPEVLHTSHLNSYEYEVIIGVTL